MGMEQENTKRVQQMYAGFGRGDIPAILNELADNVEWTVSGPKSVPPAGTRRGKAGVAEFFKVLGETAEPLSFEPREYVAQGEKVVALGRYKFKVKATGKSYESEWAMVFTFRGGKVAQFREHTDTHAIASAFAR